MERIAPGWKALGVGGAAMTVLAQTKPEEAISNIAAWAKLVGWEHMPSFLMTPRIDLLATVLGLGVLALALIMWRRQVVHVHRAPQEDTPDVEPSQSSSVATLGMKVTRAPAFNVSLTEAALYAVTGNWGMIGGKEHFATNQERVLVGNQVADWLAAFEQKASDGVVRVWGKPQANQSGPLVEIDALHWRTHEAFPISVVLGEPQSRQRLSMSREGGYDDLRVNRAEFEKEWSHA